MKHLIFIVLMLNSSIVLAENNVPEPGLKSDPQLLPGEIRNLCYKQRGVPFSKWYKFSISPAGEITKYHSAKDRIGRKHPSTFESLDQFIKESRGICTEEMEFEKNYDFKKATGRPFNKCDCQGEDCILERNRLVSLFRERQSKKPCDQTSSMDCTADSDLKAIEHLVSQV